MTTLRDDTPSGAPLRGCTPLPLLGLFLGGCSGWPQFSQDPGATSLLTLGEMEYAPWGGLEELAEDWPDMPDGSVSSDGDSSPLQLVNLAEIPPFHYFPLAGTIEHFGLPTTGPAPFDCGETSGLDGTYAVEDDVDFVRIIDNPLEAMCILLLDVDAPVTLDIVAYPFNPDCPRNATCSECDFLLGDFLTRAVNDEGTLEPAWTEPKGPPNAMTTDAREVAMYVAGAQTQDPEVEVEVVHYQIALVPTRDATFCDTLTHNNIAILPDQSGESR